MQAASMLLGAAAACGRLRAGGNGMHPWHRVRMPRTKEPQRMVVLDVALVALLFLAMSRRALVLLRRGAHAVEHGSQ